jgi:hypothetical protein
MKNNFETFEEVDGNILGIWEIPMELYTCILGNPLGIWEIPMELYTYILGNPLGTWEQQKLILCTRSQI